jgi:hypothetical protein
MIMIMARMRMRMRMAIAMTTPTARPIMPTARVTPIPMVTAMQSAPTV